MAREQCPLCGASDIEELIVLDDYPYAGNGAVRRDVAGEVPLGTLTIGVCRICSMLFQLEPVALEDLDGMLLRQPNPLPTKETGMEVTETNRFLESLKRYGPTKGDLLHVGCGQGCLMEMLSERGFAVKGVDAHPENVRKAAKKEFDVLEGRFEEGMYEDESFDVIVARSVLEHVVEPSILLSSLVNLLRPGGILALEVPDTRHIFHRSAFGGFSFHHLTCWTVPTLRYAITLQGLDPIGGYEESYVAGFARKPAKGESEHEPLPPSDEEVEETIEDANVFLDRKESLAEKLPKLIGDQFDAGVVILGAGTPTVDMLYYTGLGDEIKSVVTSDKARQGSMLANSSFVIEPMDRIRQGGFDAVLVSSERRQDDLLDRLEFFIDEGGRVLRFSPDIEVV